MKKIIGTFALLSVWLFAFGMVSCKSGEAEFFGKSKMVAIPGTDILMLNTEVTQKTYEKVMGENPSEFEGKENPVEMVSWIDAIYFCNKLSERLGYEPVYTVDGNTDVSELGYTVEKEIKQNESANGFRLPTWAEWEYAAKGGQDFGYAGSDNLDEVGWYWNNSGEKTHPVAQKKKNGYGLYDMSGNVWEWLWDSDIYGHRYSCGGSWYGSVDDCKIGRMYSSNSYYQDNYKGFRLVRVSGN